MTLTMYLIATPFGLALMCYALDRCERRDVETGRRDGMALADGYGSNRGWHWPWSPIAVLCAVLFGPGGVMIAVGMFMLVFTGK
jgi:hypothetical protein